MPHITRALLRKRAEHNEGMISTLEEISLHQEELEGISEVLGMTCRKLKILYLQNNVIPRMENLHHCKDLEYLNLALNNIQKVEGLDRCEFLNKLDLTVNFVDFDELEASITHLAKRRHLKELYMMGNPSQIDWPDGFDLYCTHRLPQLQSLDGKDLTKSLRIVAAQHYPRLQAELKVKAAECREKKRVEALAAAASKAAKKERRAARAAAKAEAIRKREEALDEGGAVVQDASESEEEPVVEDVNGGGNDDDDDDDDDDGPDIEGEIDGTAAEKKKKEPKTRRGPGYVVSKGGTYDMDDIEAEYADTDSDEEGVPHTPEARVEMYREMAEEKAEKEKVEKERQPKERDYEKEQREAIEKVRRSEEEGRVKQTNEGKWEFRFDEMSRKDAVLLDVTVPRHLDSSLIDVDIHPNYVSVVIKSKVLRLNLPAEVDSTAAKAQRSKTTGHLVLVMPKVNPGENALSIRVQSRHLSKQKEERVAAASAKQQSRNMKNVTDQMLSAAGVETTPVASAAVAGGGGKKRGGLLGGANNGAAPRGGAVSIKGLVPARKGGLRTEAPAMTAVKGSTKILKAPSSGGGGAQQQRNGFFGGDGDDDDDDDDDDEDGDEPPPPM